MAKDRIIFGDKAAKAAKFKGKFAELEVKADLIAFDFDEDEILGPIVDPAAKVVARAIRGGVKRQSLLWHLHKGIRIIGNAIALPRDIGFHLAQFLSDTGLTDAEKMLKTKEVKKGLDTVPERVVSVGSKGRTPRKKRRGRARR